MAHLAARLFAVLCFMTFSSAGVTFLWLKVGPSCNWSNSTFSSPCGSHSRVCSIVAVVYRTIPSRPTKTYLHDELAVFVVPSIYVIQLVDLVQPSLDVVRFFIRPERWNNLRIGLGDASHFVSPVFLSGLKSVNVWAWQNPASEV